MPIIESCLGILGAVSGVATLHGWFTGLSTGKQIEQVINQQTAMQSAIEKLSDGIFYADSIQQVRTLNEASNRVNDRRELREILDPVQNCLNEDILSTAVLSTPSKLRQAFQSDPFEVLIETRPVNRAKKPENPDLLPILFYENGIYYIGWQTRGILPHLFDCEYSPNKTFGNNAEPEQKITNSLGMEFVFVQPGTFMMGSPQNEPGRQDRETQHRVTLTKGFYMQTTQVTQAQWKAVMRNNPSRFKNCDACPVDKVSWNDVQEFIKKLNQIEGTNKYRLPTEAEWEYACRAGTETAYSFGGDTGRLEEYAWFDKKSGNKTHPVAQLKPNNWGLYDMHGNVWEWCQDWYGDYPTGVVTDPPGPSAGSHRVNRGGSYFGNAQYCRSAFRSYAPPRRPQRLPRLSSSEGSTITLCTFTLLPFGVGKSRLRRNMQASDSSEACSGAAGRGCGLILFQVSTLPADWQIRRRGSDLSIRTERN